MWIALDKNHTRIDADKAQKGLDYFCPVCGAPVILRSGRVNRVHFAHQARDCADSWNYDMSDWHRKMQELFSVSYREVVVEHDGIKHRADILKDNIVLEFQHSAISPNEFQERNNFYLSAGYKVVWIFDVTDQFEREKFIFKEYDYNKKLYHWKRPKQILQFAPPKLDGNDIAVYFHADDPDWYIGESDNASINRVIWRNENSTRLWFSTHYVQIKKDFDLKVFFWSRHTYTLDYARKYAPYEIRLSGTKGQHSQFYRCLKTNESLRVWGKHGCEYCQHCICIECTNEKEYSVYCGYPQIIRNPTPNNMQNDVYEYSRVEFICK